MGDGKRDPHQGEGARRTPGLTRAASRDGPDGKGAAKGEREAVREAARTLEPDRYVSALLSPRAAQGDLIALAAFVGEIRRIDEIVREPLLAEIRLQWWREAIQSEPEARTGSPVADAMRGVLETVAAPDAVHGLVLDMFDAHTRALHGSPLSLAELADFATCTDGVAFRLAAQIIGGELSAETAALCDTGGKAYGIARALCSPSRSELTAEIGPAVAAARGNVEAARVLFSDAPRDIRAAMLPLALVEPYLRALERGHRGPSRHVARITPLTRVWRLWRAERRGRF